MRCLSWYKLLLRSGAIGCRITLHERRSNGKLNIMEWKAIGRGQVFYIRLYGGTYRHRGLFDGGSVTDLKGTLT